MLKKTCWKNKKQTKFRTRYRLCCFVEKMICGTNTDNVSDGLSWLLATKINWFWLECYRCNHITVKETNFPTIVICLWQASTFIMIWNHFILSFITNFIKLKIYFNSTFNLGRLWYSFQLLSYEKCIFYITRFKVHSDSLTFIYFAKYMKEGPKKVETFVTPSIKVPFFATANQKKKKKESS